MENVVHISAPCKLNLHLRVLARRMDGYHDIESVFQLISLADELSVSIRGAENSCEVVSPRMELPLVNTITRATDLFRSATGIQDGLRVDIAKRVPSGAGLGGGSSDAAAVLVALNRLFSAGLASADLMKLAAQIGSDVPFFLSGAAAVVEGRGERVSPIASRDDLAGVLIWPAVHSSTAEAYGLVDRWHEAGNDRGALWPPVSELERLYRSPVSDWQFGNSFQEPLEARYPAIGDARHDLAGAGAVFSAMTGSGSAVFGLFTDAAAAEAAHKTLSARWQTCVKFLLLASSPMQ
jgi:4-diphosphocytidyl-2-C-methyl-D-erythritol kinase